MSTFFTDIAGVFTSVSDAIFTYTPRAILFVFVLTGFLVIYGKIWSYFRMLWSVYLSSGNRVSWNFSSSTCRRVTFADIS
jgi:hypothetical protein